jgi:hypothetical protein
MGALVTAMRLAKGHKPVKASSIGPKTFSQSNFFRSTLFSKSRSRANYHTRHALLFFGPLRRSGSREPAGRRTICVQTGNDDIANAIGLIEKALGASRSTTKVEAAPIKRKKLAAPTSFNGA